MSTRQVTGHILVVDDDPINRDILSRWLLGRGHTVHGAGNGVDALDLLARHPVDVILLDVQMPGMSGLELLQAIRSREVGTPPSVIMVTANSETQDVVTALERGADDYLTKPVNVPIALARVQTQLLRKRAEERLRESEERFALAAAGSNDGLWDWKIEANTVHFSVRWKDILGYADDEIGSSPDEWFGRVHPLDRPAVQREIDAHLAGVSPLFESEYRMRHKSGAYRWVLTRGLSTRTPDGRACRMAGSFSDVHDGKVVDVLTGLPNRLLLLDRLERALHHACDRPDSGFALLFLDLDGFKVVNDSLGHLVGDELIQAVAARLEAGLRGRDSVARPTLSGTPDATSDHTLARLGGDEFIVLLHDVRSASAAAAVAERLQDALARPFQIGGREVLTSASIGIAVSGGGYSRPDELLRDADTAMYRAKASGRGGIEVFDGDMREEAVARLKTDTALRLGLERHEFLPYYQPIVEFATGRLVGFEALLRWKNPEVGVVSPGQFVHILEESGLLIPVGRRFLRDVCTQLRLWHEQIPGASELWVNVNFAGRQFLDEGLATRIAECTLDAQLSPRHVLIEITEATAISNFELTLATVEQLRTHGIRVALDDFGTGYSSLACLDQLPISGIKLDPTFTRREAKRPEILRAVVALAHELGLTVTAEGVETLDQYERLLKLGCEYAQGYLFSRPLDAAQITKALVTGRRWLPEERYAQA